MNAHLKKMKKKIEILNKFKDFKEKLKKGKVASFDDVVLVGNG